MAGVNINRYETYLQTQTPDKKQFDKKELKNFKRLDDAFNKAYGAGTEMVTLDYKIALLNKMDTKPVAEGDDLSDGPASNGNADGCVTPAEIKYFMENTSVKDGGDQKSFMKLNFKKSSHSCN